MSEDSLWFDAGRTLALLDKPMGKAEVRAFAERAVNRAAKLDESSDRRMAMFGFLVPELADRGALRHHIVLVADAVLDAVDKAHTLTEARHVLGSMWTGALIHPEG
jgi:hypothetical protein